VPHRFQFSIDFWVVSICNPQVGRHVQMWMPMPMDADANRLHFSFAELSPSKQT